MEYIHVTHTFEPVYDQESKILILGSFPSVKSRKQNFYYGHPQNRFWKVVSAVFEAECPRTIEEKKKFLFQNKIALWDVIAECDIKGSSDSSIRNAIPNDMNVITKFAEIKAVYANGATAYRLYQKYCEKQGVQKAVKLPSTSPANAAFNLERLIMQWKEIKNSF